MDEKLARKKEQLRDVVELLECDGYNILTTEIERLGKQGETECCDVKLPQAERDAGAGKKVMAEQILAYLPQLKASLEKTTTSGKQQRE